MFIEMERGVRMVASVVFVFAMMSVTSGLHPDQIVECVNSHNKVRALHFDTPPVTWDDQLARRAQRYADELLRDHQGRRSIKLKHEYPSGGMGENLFWRDNSDVAPCAQATLDWYNEIKDYDYSTARSRNRKPVGHFTQVVWRNTKRIGVGIATGKSRRYPQYGNVETFIVAKYSPRGNFYYVGRRLEGFSENVKPRIPGSITPSLQELQHPMRVVKLICVNKIATRWCEFQIRRRGNSCKAQFFKVNCASYCGQC